MRKKWIRLIAAAMGSFLLAGCGADTQIDDYATNAGAESVQQTSGTESAAAAASATEGIPKDEIKVGVLHLSDPAEGSGYTYTHDLGIQGMQQNLGLSDDQIVRKINVSDSDEDATKQAIQECIDEGCNIICDQLGLHGGDSGDGGEISRCLFFPWNRLYEQRQEFQ